MGQKNGICVETRTYVVTLFVGRRRQNEGERCDTELMCWFIFRLDRFVFDCVDFTPCAVTDGCERGYTSVHSHIIDDLIIHKVVKQDVREFIRRGVKKKWIVLCESRQYFFEVVAMHKT